MSVEIDLSPRGDRIILRSTYPTPGLGGVALGARFSGSKSADPHWSIPLSMDSCYALREHFGPEMRVGTALADWARQAIETEREISALGRATDATLLRVPEVSPRLAGAMSSRTYQRAGARFLAETVRARGGAMNCDQPGLGKTLETIGAVIEMGIPGPYLVVCPKTAVEPVWAREVPRWWPGQTVITLPDGRAKRDEILDRLVHGDLAANHGLGHSPSAALRSTWVVVHPEIMRVRSYVTCQECGAETKWKAGPLELSCGHYAEHRPPRTDDATFPQMFQVPWTAIIVDESSRALLRRTGTPNLVRRGMELVRDENPNAVRIAQDGTPFRSRPMYLWGTLNWLQPRVYTSSWRFYEQFWEVSDGYGGSKKVGTELLPGAEERLDRTLNGIMIRRTKAEVAPDMPAKTYGGTPLDPADAFSPVAVWLPMGRDQQRLYDQMREVAAASLAGGELTALGVLAERTRLKQFAIAAGEMIGKDDFRPVPPSNKLDWVIEKLLEMGYPSDPTGKIIIASQFTAVLRMFHAEISKAFDREHKGWDARRRAPMLAGITGAVTGPRRTEVLDTFNMPVGTDSPHILFIQTKTGGVAITIDSADEMIVLDETDTPDDQEQLEDRIHRVSKPRPVTYWYLKSLNSIDEEIALSNAERSRQSHQVLDGRRGLEFKREVKA